MAKVIKQPPVAAPKSPKKLVKQKGARKKISPATTRKLLLFFGVLLLVLLVVAAARLFIILSDDRIVQGVSVDGLPTDGMTEEELANALERKYRAQMDDEAITLHQGLFERRIAFSELDAAANIEQMVLSATAIGHEGFFLRQLSERLSARKKPYAIPLTVSFSADKMNKVLKEMYEVLHVLSNSPTLRLSHDAVTLTTGTKGQQIDTTLLASRIVAVLQTGKSGSLHIPMQESLPAAIDADALYKAIVTDPRDAEVVKDEMGNAVIRPHVTGKQIDQDILTETVRSLEMRDKTRSDTVELPVSFTQPKITTEQAEKQLFRDVMAVAETSFELETENDKNRLVNIRLIAAAIDGQVLWPDEEWSFNGTTGERTAAGGYVKAHAYRAGKIVDEIGGGICQVSTTLFNAALANGLDVPERHAHSYAVPYAAYGRDAAVSWNTLDLKLKNNWSWPIRIQVEILGKSVRISLIGTNLNPEYNVKIYTKTLSVHTRERLTQEDATIPVGTSKIIEPGVDGAVVETWRKAYRGTTQLTDLLLFESRYAPFPELTAIGTGLVTENEE